MPELVLLTTEGLHVPVIPLSDGEYNVGTVPPEQIVSVVPKLNVGVIFGLTVTTNVAGNAHCPAVGVNVYTPEFWLSTTAGLHVPVIPFNDGLVNTGTDPPAQMVRFVPKLNVGVMFGLTVTVKLNGNAHKPGVGVNV